MEYMAEGASGPATSARGSCFGNVFHRMAERKKGCNRDCEDVHPEREKWRSPSAFRRVHSYEHLSPASCTGRIPRRKVEIPLYDYGEVGAKLEDYGWRKGATESAR